MTQLNQNDSRIFKLKEKIEKKRESIENKVLTFKPETNCMVSFDDGSKYNIHASNIERLTLLLVKLNMMKLSSIDLGLDLEDVVLSDYPLSLWIKDVTNKLDVAKRKEEVKNLEKMEKKLESLLSEDVKLDLEISEIEKML